MMLKDMTDDCDERDFSAAIAAALFIALGILVAVVVLSPFYFL